MQNIFNQISEIIPRLDGWCSVERATELAALIIGTKPEITICIGVYAGRETFAMALAHRANQKGKVIAIDPWSESASVIGQGEADAEWWGKPGLHSEIYDKFTANLKTLGLQEWVDIRRATSDQAYINDRASTKPFHQVGVLVVDGNHGPQSIRDVDNYADHVALGGFVYMDDIGWTGGSVREAVKLLQTGYRFKQLYERDTGAFFQRLHNS